MTNSKYFPITWRNCYGIRAIIACDCDDDMARPGYDRHRLILIYLAIAKNYEPTYCFQLDWSHLGKYPLLIGNYTNRSCYGTSCRRGIEYIFQCGNSYGDFSAADIYCDWRNDRFSPLFRNPSLLLFGAAAQFGIL